MLAVTGMVLAPLLRQGIKGLSEAVQMLVALGTKKCCSGGFAHRQHADCFGRGRPRCISNRKGCHQETVVSDKAQ